VEQSGTIFTVGHSTRTMEQFLRLLQSHGILALADVRKYPGSRRLPWFGATVMAKELAKAGLKYLPFPELGGRRQPTGDATNAAWRDAGFRGYADYMQTEAFAAALERLMDAARQTPLAMMCAEAVPWRCHRSLIADALLVRGWRVMDIFSESKATPHNLTPFAKVEGRRITYPTVGQEGPLFDWRAASGPPG